VTSCFFLFLSALPDPPALSSPRRSGKTTLLNHILKGDHGKRIVVIENEFGEIDIDSETGGVPRRRGGGHSCC
jgi:predicted AAA+ superfamily ATPase